MTDAEKRDKIIKGLECRLDINGSKYKHCLTCDYRHDIDHCQWACQTDGILEDALAMLKAQEPRLLTFDELIATDHFYIETNKDGQKYIVPGIVTIVRDTAVIASVRIRTRLIDCTIDKDVYGIECRCWTSHPTDKQRQAVKWK